MFVFGKCGCIRSKVVVFGKSGSIPVLFGQKGLYLGKSGSIRAKVVAFGQKLLYLRKKGCNRATWLCSVYVVVLGQKLL